MTAKKSFGQHVEDGLTFLGDAHIKGKDHELETLKLGLLTDEEKLRMLKQDLYRQARGDRDSINIRLAIETLEDSLDRKLQRQVITNVMPIPLLDTFVSVVRLVFGSGFLLFMLFCFATFHSETCTPKNDSQFCREVGEIGKYFYNPKK